jgi:hypothetical protein
MNFSIWKFELQITDIQTLYIPEGADILSVQNQNGELCMWAIVDIHVPKVPRHFKVIGTGHRIETLKDTKWIATVRHVFEVK